VDWADKPGASVNSRASNSREQIPNTQLSVRLVLTEVALLCAAAGVHHYFLGLDYPDRGAMR